ncbi:hypothetical protein FNF28_02372 [Cafeteria roenbergensis]|uniref:Autophagy-related protein 11 C-terminal domain-containing protein n=1 Tax=Cafeteria roenbergensis TaxID=33653 RepID=A0A5A8DTK7_CAFRO|nr:hypothetical protein FNF28_02372 [Cafeteria roenbergensis]
MAAETEQLEIPFVNATTGLRSTLVTERTESAESFRSKLAGEVNASAGDLIVIVGGKFKQLDSDTTPARLADETGESAELFVFTRDFVVQAQEAMDVAASPGDGGSAAASGVRASADLGPAPLGDVRAALLGDADAPLGDEAAVRELLAPVAAWFAGLDHEELSAERETWTAAVTPGADGESAAAAGSSGAGSSMAGSPLLATLPSYIRRLRRLHLALAAYRRTAVERARWAEAAHQRAVDSCRCGDAAVRNLGRLAASLRAKTRAAADRLRPKADRWTRMAARAPTYWSRLEKIPVSRAMLPGTAGEAVATLADTVPEGAMRGWAEACGSNAVALKGAVDGLLEDVRAFLVGVSKALMRRARQAARQASDVLASAVAGGSTAPGGATASVIMTAITELEATLSEALDEALPALKAEDEKAVAAQGSVAEALGACRKVLLHRLGAVAQRQSDIVSLFTRRGAIEAAGEVLGEQCAELEHLRSLPKAYAAAATEAVRRRAFTHELNSRLRDIGEELGRMRAQEAERRDQFNRRLGQHLPSSLAPWLQERPPHVEIGDGSPLSEQVSGRGSPTPGDSSPTEAGTDAAARRRSADVASASRALRAAADEEARERMRIVRLEHENASLVAELTALLAVVEVGSDSSSDSSSESEGGSDDEGDGATALPSRSPPMCSDGDEDADGDDEASGRLRNAVASPRSGGASAPASAATANDAPRSFQRRFDAAPPGMPDLGSPSAAGSPESAAGAVARGLSGRVYELATLASSGAAKAMGPLSAALEAAQAEAERMAAPAYGSAPDAPGMDLSRAAAAATPLRLKAATRTPPGGPHAARPGAEPRSREAGLQLIREAADMAAKPPTAHRPGGPSGGAGSGLGIAAQGTPSAVAAAAGYAPGRGGQFPLRAAPVLSESEPPTPNRSLHPFQSPEGTDDAADESGGADEASPGAGGGRKQTDPGSAGAASGATARASAPRITAPGPGRLGDWMGAVTGRPSRLPPTSQPLAARQLARARSSAALPGSRTTSSGSSSAGAGAAGGAGQRVAAAYAAVSAAHAVIMASPGRASAAGDSEGFPCRAQEWDGTPASSRVYPETVVNVVRRMAKQLDDAVRVAQSLGKRMGELEQRDQKRVSFLDFRPGDLALFMRAQVRCPATGNPVYVVLHHGCPRFYLSEPAADDARDGDEAWPDLVLVRIESVSARIAGHRGTRDNRVSVEPGATFWEAAGTPLYTMTDGIVRTSPALSAAD